MSRRSSTNVPRLSITTEDRKQFETFLAEHTPKFDSIDTVTGITESRPSSAFEPAVERFIQENTSRPVSAQGISSQNYAAQVSKETRPQASLLETLKGPPLKLDVNGKYVAQSAITLSNTTNAFRHSGNVPVPPLAKPERQATSSIDLSTPAPGPSGISRPARPSLSAPPKPILLTQSAAYLTGPLEIPPPSSRANSQTTPLEVPSVSSRANSFHSSAREGLATNQGSFQSVVDRPSNATLSSNTNLGVSSLDFQSALLRISRLEGSITALKDRQDSLHSEFKYFQATSSANTQGLKGSHAILQASTLTETEIREMVEKLVARERNGIVSSVLGHSTLLKSIQDQVSSLVQKTVHDTLLSFPFDGKLRALETRLERVEKDKSGVQSPRINNDGEHSLKFKVNGLESLIRELQVRLEHLAVNNTSDFSFMETDGVSDAEAVKDLQGLDELQVIGEKRGKKSSRSPSPMRVSSPLPTTTKPTVASQIIQLETRLNTLENSIQTKFQHQVEELILKNEHLKSMVDKLVHKVNQKGLTPESSPPRSKPAHPVSNIGGISSYSVSMTSPSGTPYTVEFSDILNLLDTKISEKTSSFATLLNGKVDTTVLEELVRHIATREEVKKKLSELKKKISSKDDEAKNFKKIVREELHPVWELLNPLCERQNEGPKDEKKSRERDQTLLKEWVNETVADQVGSASSSLELEFAAFKRQLLASLSGSPETMENFNIGKNQGLDEAEMEQRVRQELKTWVRKHVLNHYIDKDTLLMMQQESQSDLKNEILKMVKAQVDVLKQPDVEEDAIPYVHPDHLQVSMSHWKKNVMREMDEKLFLLCSDLSAIKTLYSRQVSQPFYKCAQWLWKSNTLKMGSAVPWNYQTVNTDTDNFKWEQDSITIRVQDAGLYEINFAFFTKSKPSIQLVVNGDSVLSAIHSPSYVVHHSSGFVLDGEGRLEPGCISGISLIDFLALPAKSTLSIHHHGVKKGSLGHGFLGLKRL